MIRFITTSPSFAGEVHLIYGDDQVLQCLDMRHAQLSREQAHYLRMHTPTVFDAASFEAAFGTAKLHFVHEAYVIRFEDWWQRYGKKINKLRAEKVWARLSKAKQAQAYASLAAYDRHLHDNKWKNKLDPENYLRNESWNNEWN